MLIYRLVSHQPTSEKFLLLKADNLHRNLQMENVQRGGDLGVLTAQWDLFVIPITLRLRDLCGRGRQHHCMYQRWCKTLRNSTHQTQQGRCPQELRETVAVCRRLTPSQIRQIPNTENGKWEQSPILIQESILILS